MSTAYGLALKREILKSSFCLFSVCVEQFVQCGMPYILRVAFRVHCRVCQCDSWVLSAGRSLRWMLQWGLLGGRHLVCGLVRLQVVFQY